MMRASTKRNRLQLPRQCAAVAGFCASVLLIGWVSIAPPRAPSAALTQQIAAHEHAGMIVWPR